MRQDYITVELGSGPCQRQAVLSSGIWMDSLIESFRQGFAGYGYDKDDKMVFAYWVSSDPELKIDDLEDGGLAFGEYEEDGYFLKLSKAKADKFFREWYEIMKKKPARIGIWSDGENLRIKASRPGRSPITSWASVVLNNKGEKVAGFGGGELVLRILREFAIALRAEVSNPTVQADLHRFLEDHKVRETKIAGFDLAKKLWKISISKEQKGWDIKPEVLVTRKELLKVIDDFHAAMATKPDQIAIVRDNRGLIVVTEKTVEDLLF